ncbi:ATP-dependent DNA helicase [Nymphaea thermarum]|nr:ATP-dependent DNA helicase [Nymphaea thermarum]
MAVIVEDDAGERREDDCGRVAVKDPRTIARGYQLALCKKAMEENIIVYLETGCGKTHIAVLLMYELGHMIRKPQKSVCVFLAPTVHLVQQQAVVIGHSTNFKVGTYFGAQKHLDNHKEWESELDKYESTN